MSTETNPAETPETDTLAEELLPLADSITAENVQAKIGYILRKLFLHGQTIERQRDEARQLVTQYSAEREHNANMAQMWRAVADDACELLVSMPCLSSGQEREKASIAKAYEEAKSYNLTASPP